MRFSTFMLSYKKKHKQLKSTITFRKLPFYQKIDLLIDEAKQAKQDANLFLPIKKPVKALSVLIVPITIYIIQQQFTSSNVGASNVILLLVYCILIFVAVYTLISFIEGIMYGIYDDLIYDLRQLKIFYVKEK